LHDSVGAVRDLVQNHLLQVVARTPATMSWSLPGRQDHHRPNNGTIICRTPATTNTNRMGQAGVARHTGRARECGCAQEAPLVSSR
jgi:hypothetical protein